MWASSTNIRKRVKPQWGKQKGKETVLYFLVYPNNSHGDILPISSWCNQTMHRMKRVLHQVLDVSMGYPKLQYSRRVKWVMSSTMNVRF